MKSFSSSAINKSGKKFAPKAPIRRAAPAPVAPARRTSTVSQSHISIANASQERDVSDTIPPPSASPAPEQPSVTGPEPAAIPVPPAPKSATAIPLPRPKRKASVSAPSVQKLKVIPEISATEDSTSPRALPIDRQVIPSIESDIELPGTTTATGGEQPEGDVEQLAEVAAQPEPAPESQASVADPFKIKAKRKPGITTASREISTFATPPATQNVIPTIEGSAVPAATVPSATPEPSHASAKGKKRKTKTDSETPKPKRIRRKKREPTPDGAETVEILPNVIKMSELCKDLKTGRKSKRETELRRLEFEEHERKLKAQEEGLNAPVAAKDTTEAETQKEDRLPPPKPQSGPVMRIVNGEIVLDTASLEVDRHADAARSAGDLEDVVENQLTRKINQSTYGKRTKAEAWDEGLTDLFYRGLSMFGTDFMVISKLFPGRSRRQIKLKFNNEERRDPQRIKEALLGPREVIDIATYSELTNEVYDDPKVIQQELDEEKKRIEEQHEKEMKLRDEMIRNPSGTDKNPDGSDKGKGASGRGKARNSKKQNTKNQGGGTEEVLGTIDGVPVT